MNVTGTTCPRMTSSFRVSVSDSDVLGSLRQVQSGEADDTVLWLNLKCKCLYRITFGCLVECLLLSC